VIARGQGLDEVARPPLIGRRAPARLVLEIPLIAGADVFTDQHLIAGKVLEDDTDALAQRALIPQRQILPVEQDPACRGCVQAGQQLDQGGFA
jgi:hypothetical protein